MRYVRDIRTIALSIIAVGMAAAALFSGFVVFAVKPVMREGLAQASRESFSRDSLNQARAESRDSLLAARMDRVSANLARMSQDRIVLVAILETNPGPARQAFISLIKDQWTREAELDLNNSR